MGRDIPKIPRLVDKSLTVQDHLIDVVFKCINIRQETEGNYTYLSLQTDHITEANPEGKYRTRSNTLWDDLIVYQKDCPFYAIIRNRSPNSRARSFVITQPSDSEWFAYLDKHSKDRSDYFRDHPADSQKFKDWKATQ